ncbi:MAG: hypothetical protein OXF02_00890 [Simkaniaceae bacterium]|nr:hypothetical protein [Simkaniaceae bacterium]
MATHVPTTSSGKDKTPPSRPTPPHSSMRRVAERTDTVVGFDCSPSPSPDLRSRFDTRLDFGDAGSEISELQDDLSVDGDDVPTRPFGGVPSPGWRSRSTRFDTRFDLKGSGSEISELQDDLSVDGDDVPTRPFGGVPSPGWRSRSTRFDTRFDLKGSGSETSELQEDLSVDGDDLPPRPFGDAPLPAYPRPRESVTPQPMHPLSSAGAPPQPAGAPPQPAGAPPQSAGAGAGAPGGDRSKEVRLGFALGMTGAEGKSFSTRDRRYLHRGQEVEKKMGELSHALCLDNTPYRAFIARNRDGKPIIHTIAVYKDIVAPAEGDEEIGPTFTCERYDVTSEEGRIRLLLASGYRDRIGVDIDYAGYRYAVETGQPLQGLFQQVSDDLQAVEKALNECALATAELLPIGREAPHCEEGYVGNCNRPDVVSALQSPSLRKFTDNSEFDKRMQSIAEFMKQNPHLGFVDRDAEGRGTEGVNEKGRAVIGEILATVLLIREEKRGLERRIEELERERNASNNKRTSHLDDDPMQRKSHQANEENRRESDLKTWKIRKEQLEQMSELMLAWQMLQSHRDVEIVYEQPRPSEMVSAQEALAIIEGRSLRVSPLSIKHFVLPRGGDEGGGGKEIRPDSDHLRVALAERSAEEFADFLSRECKVGKVGKVGKILPSWLRGEDGEVVEKEKRKLSVGAGAMFFYETVDSGRRPNARILHRLYYESKRHGTDESEQSASEGIPMPGDLSGAHWASTAGRQCVVADAGGVECARLRKGKAAYLNPASERVTEQMSAVTDAAMESTRNRLGNNLQREDLSTLMRGFRDQLKEQSEGHERERKAEQQARIRARKEVSRNEGDEHREIDLAPRLESEGGSATPSECSGARASRSSSTGGDSDDSDDSDATVSGVRATGRQSPGQSYGEGGSVPVLPDLLGVSSDDLSTVAFPPDEEEETSSPAPYGNQGVDISASGSRPEPDEVS